MRTRIHDRVKYLCSPRDIVQSSDDYPDIDSILSYETVIAQQDYICGKIGAPTTFIHFRKDAEGLWERLDSQISAITLRTSCDALRRCNKDGGSWCEQCDESHADIFIDLCKGPDIIDRLNQSIDAKLETWNKMYQNKEHKPIVGQRSARVYLSYDCPMLGYRELMFPIFFENKVIAVFVIGQIKLEGQEDNIKRAKSDFFRQRSDVFSAYLRNEKILNAMKMDRKKFPPKKYSISGIQGFVCNKSAREIAPEYLEVYQHKPGMIIPVYEDITTIEKYEETLEKICNWIESFEELLVNEMDRKRSSYVRKAIDGATASFHANWTGTSDDSIRDLWSNVNIFFQQIADYCGIRYVIAFSAGSTEQKMLDSLPIVAQGGLNLPSDAPFPLASYEDKFILDNVLSYMEKPCHSDQIPQLFCAIPERFQTNAEIKTVLLQPMKSIPAATVILLLEYYSPILKKSIGDTINSNLLNFCALLSSQLTVQFENAAQRQLQRILRMYRHEINTLTIGLKRPIHRYLGNPRLKEINQDKLNDVYNDAVGTLAMLQSMSDNIGILLKTPRAPEKERFDLYYKILYKWENYMRDDVHDKQCEILYRKSSTFIYTDAKYSELVIYNLISNAVKYAYCGTNIYFHCQPDQTTGKHKLSIIDYGFAIPQALRELIFEIGYRSEVAQVIYPDGSGIGLYIVKYIMEYLGGEVLLAEPTCISEYNIPMLYAYINNKNYEIDRSSEVFFEALHEYRRLEQTMYFNDLEDEVSAIDLVVSRQYRGKRLKAPVYPELAEVNDNLKIPTYKIRFEVFF